MENNIAEVRTKKDFELFCRLYDQTQGLIYNQDKLVKRGRFSYETKCFYEENCYDIYFELERNKNALLKVKLMNRTIVNPGLVYNSIETVKERVYNDYAQIKLLIVDLEEMKERFDHSYDIAFASGTKETYLQLSYLAEHLNFKLNAMSSNATGFAKEEIDNVRLYILSKTISLHSALNKCNDNKVFMVENDRSFV